MRALRITSAAACAALACVVALATAAVPASAAGPQGCATSGLVVWLDTRGDAAAGSAYYPLRFTNLTDRRCTLYGYPGVSAVDLRGRRLGSAASRDRAFTPGVVVLEPGATATGTLRITDASNFSPTDCRPVTAAGLRVYPPGRTASKLVPFPFRACSLAGPVYLSVRAVRPG
jgi:hypothetical protein